MRRQTAIIALVLLLGVGLLAFGQGQGNFPAGAGTFATLGSGTNTSGTFTCGTGCTINTTGTGSIAGTPCGTNGQFQFNNSSACGGTTGMTFSPSSGNTVTITGQTLNQAALQVTANGNRSMNIGASVNFDGVGDLNFANAAGIISALTIGTGSNCSSSASPAVCGSAAAGSVVVAAAATTVQVNTTAVTANSQILLTRDDSLGTKLSVTCNTATVMGEMKVSARTGGSNFTITVQTTPATNPGCISYTIIN